MAWNFLEHAHFYDWGIENNMSSLGLVKTSNKISSLARDAKRTGRASLLCVQGAFGATSDDNGA